MTDIDLSAQFDKISEKAKNASDKLKAARQGTRDRLESDVISARDRASAAADRFNDKAVDAKDKASSQWQEMRAKWQAHVAKVKTTAERKRQDSSTRTSPPTMPTLPKTTHWRRSTSRRQPLMRPSRRCWTPCIHVPMRTRSTPPLVDSTAM